MQSRYIPAFAKFAVMSSMSKGGDAPRPKYKPSWDLFRFVPASASAGQVFLQVYSPVNPPPPIPLTLYPSPKPAPPLIYHLASPLGIITETTLVELISTHTSLSKAFILELVEFGAVYLRATHPNPRTSPRAVRQTLTSAKVSLPTHTPLYMRLYVNPKRHVARTPLHILQDAEGIIAICKPAGLPMAASADNVKECVTAAVANRLGLHTRDIHITSRLDVGTTGVVLLARSRAVGNELNSMLATSEKRYLVWSHTPPRPGIYRDWYNKHACLGRGVVKTALLRQRTDDEQPQAVGTWVPADLVVEHVAPAGNIWKSIVKLETGRTHQIRLQFAARGYGVVGDIKYENVTGRIWSADVLQLRLGPDATMLGLHSWRIDGNFRGRPVSFFAEGQLRSEQ